MVTGLTGEHKLDKTKRAGHLNESLTPSCIHEMGCNLQMLISNGHANLLTTEFNFSGFP